MNSFFAPISSRCKALFLVALAAFAIFPDATAKPAWDFKNGDRVLFIGDSFFEREVDYGNIEMRLTAAFPNRTITFRNLAWAADTPMGRSRASFDWNKSEDEWLKRVKEQVALVKPNVAFLSYGMTAALEGEARIPDFIEEMNALMDAIKAASEKEVRFVLLGPLPRRPNVSGTFPEIDADNSRRFAVQQALQTLARRRDADFISFGVFAGSVKYDIHQNAVPLSDDGVTPNEAGNDFAAQQIVRYFRDGDLTVGPERAEEVLRSAIRKKNELFFHRWRPANWTYLFGFRKHEQGQNAGEIPKFEPLIAEWETRIARLRDVKHQDPSTVKEVRQLLEAEERLAAQIHQPTKAQTLPSFTVADGFEVNLWAETPMLSKPIQMNFDERGRLWIASSETYPQIAPGQSARDKIIVLEDRNYDGTAETFKVFAEGLLIPTGVLPDGQGGCYVAASHQLLHFADKDRNGKADEKKIVLSSFGTEDTHHNLHTLRWGFDGHLYLNQSIYTHSHVETPHGVARLNSGGIWRFNPVEWEMEIFTRGGCNPWGHHWDNFGNSFFTDGAGSSGVYHAVPGAMYFTYAGARRELASISPGSYPKFCGFEIVRTPQFPDDWQGDFITCDFRAQRIVRFKNTVTGSSFQTTEMPDLLRSTNVTFRPIDVKFGPDGALYIADWSNPIIQHGEVDFRDPRRDHEHGRIWRVTAKGRPVPKKVNLTRLSISKLLDATLSANIWEREQARLQLKLQPHKDVLAAIKPWLSRNDDLRASLEALWLYESLGEVEPVLLKKVLGSPMPELRAAAVRVLANWIEKIPDAKTLLAQRIKDEHPRVRLETLRALAKIPSAESAALALSALELSMDSALDYALWLTINDLSEPWIAALQNGEWKPEGREKQLEFALKAIEPAKAGRVLSQMLARQPLTADGAGPWIELIGLAGSPAELKLLFDQVTQKKFDEPATVRALAALREAARLRNLKPGGSRAGIADLFADNRPAVSTAAMRLAGAWKESGSVLRKLFEVASAPDTPAELRAVAFESLQSIGGDSVATGLVSLARTTENQTVRRQATAVLAVVDLNRAVPTLTALLPSLTDENEALEFWRAVLTVKGAARAIAEALPESGIPAAAAKAGRRAAREGGRNEFELIAALLRGSGLAEPGTDVTASLITELAARASQSGDPIRGEMVYRRAELTCVQCHAIGGAGGKVGPDLTSIGASAQVDYLVESILLPNVKIKEGYHAVVVETKDGQEFSGTLMRETGEELVLRNATDQETSIAKNNIENRTLGKLSLMPSGLLENLSEQEQLDLFAFLSRLGKPGEFDASKGGVARRWRLYVVNHEDLQLGRENRVWTEPLTAKMWTSIFSLVNGRLPQAIIREASKRAAHIANLSLCVATELQVARSGPVKFKFDAPGGAELWVNGKKCGSPGECTAELTPGTHRVMIRMDVRSVPEYIRLESPDAIFLTK